MAYTPTSWADGSEGGTPITAAELNRIETGIEGAHNDIAALPAPLTIGTTSTTAKAGDYQPTAANITDASTVGRSVLTAADAAAARTAIGAGTSDATETPAGTRAQLDAGTDTVVRAFSAKDIAEYVAAQIAAAAV